METLVFPGRYRSLANISEFVKKAAQEADFDAFTIYTVETAVDEACSNIIEHAYGGEDKGVIEVSVGYAENELTIILKDYGQPFIPEEIPDPNLTDNLFDREGHGLGLYMMRQWMDEVHFSFDKSGNLLKLVKYKGS